MKLLFWIRQVLRPKKSSFGVLILLKTRLAETVLGKNLSRPQKLGANPFESLGVFLGGFS